ncbi:GNAT family N-acetyltransferase [uncultured Roseobacter sp.]|uniref:GNAT family N-acetyltransferase n=1 Tax=uncultured Roseobacter sp. TaxID=114847 RepID=UPI00344BA608
MPPAPTVKSSSRLTGSRPLAYGSSCDLRNPPVVPTLRPANKADLPALAQLADIATRDLLGPFLNPAQRRHASTFTPFDPWLITDGTYFVVELDGVIRASGGWSRRPSLIHQSTPEAEYPKPDPSGTARIRAMYTEPIYARRGLGRVILSVCEVSARLSGHHRLELLATPVGKFLYLSCGFETLECKKLQVDEGVTYSVFRMQKFLHRKEPGPSNTSSV